MQMQNQHGSFLIEQVKTDTPNEISFLIDKKCKHSVQDGPLAEVNPDGSLTDNAFDALANIVMEDHLEFCLGKTVVPEQWITEDLFGES